MTPLQTLRHHVTGAIERGEGVAIVGIEAPKRAEVVTCCYHCGKAISGDAVRTVPPNYMIDLGIDFPKSWHADCYAKNEANLEAELHGKPTLQKV